MYSESEYADYLLGQITKKIVKCLNTNVDKVDYFLFGSKLTGYGSNGSDVDMSVNLPMYKDVKSLKKFLRKLKFRFETSGWKSELVLTTRILLMRLSKDDMKFDVSFNNIFPILNTIFLRYFFYSCPSSRHNVLFLKNLATSREFGSTRYGQISPYCLTLMMVRYLQKTKSIYVNTPDYRLWKRMEQLEDWQSIEAVQSLTSVSSFVVQQQKYNAESLQDPTLLETLRSFSFFLLANSSINITLETSNTYVSPCLGVKSITFEYDDVVYPFKRFWVHNIVDNLSDVIRLFFIPKMTDPYRYLTCQYCEKLEYRQVLYPQNDTKILILYFELWRLFIITRLAPSERNLLSSELVGIAERDEFLSELKYMWDTSHLLGSDALTEIEERLLSSTFKQCQNNFANKYRHLANGCSACENGLVREFHNRVNIAEFRNNNGKLSYDLKQEWKVIKKCNAQLKGMLSTIIENIYTATINFIFSEINKGDRKLRAAVREQCDEVFNIQRDNMFAKLM